MVVIAQLVYEYTDKYSCKINNINIINYNND